MNINNLMAMLFGAWMTYENDRAALAATGTIDTPQYVVGSEGGKPLYAKVVFSTTKT